MKRTKTIKLTLILAPVLILIALFAGWISYLFSDESQFLRSGMGPGLNDDELSVLVYELPPLFDNATNSYAAHKQIKEWLGYSLGKDKLRLLQHASDDYPYAKYRLGKYYLWKDTFGFDLHRKHGIRLLTEAAEDGSAEAQILLAGNYSRSGGVAFKKHLDRDDLKCINYYLMAAKQGHPGACFNAGLMYINGVGVTNNSAEGLKWIQKGLEHKGNRFLPSTHYSMHFDRQAVFENCLILAELGNQAAQLYIGRAYLFGEDGAPCTDSSKGWEWVQKAIDQNNAEAQYMRAYHLLKAHSKYSGNKPLLQKDVAQGLELTIRAATNGSAWAQIDMYNNFRFGNNGCPEDPELAFKYLEMAARGGNALGQEWMGDQYVEKGGKPYSLTSNSNRAANWYERAWKNGQKEALPKLRKSLLAAKKYHDAFPYWYAAAQHDPYAQCIIGKMYLNGQGIETNLEEAIFWLKRSAIKGNNAEAQHTLSYCYHNGAGVLEDYKESYAWSLICSKNGGDQSMKNLLQKKLSMDQIMDAQTRAKELQKEIEKASHSNI